MTPFIAGLSSRINYRKIFHSMALSEASELIVMHQKSTEANMSESLNFTEECARDHDRLMRPLTPQVRAMVAMRPLLLCIRRSSCTVMLVTLATVTLFCDCEYYISESRQTPTAKAAFRPHDPRFFSWLSGHNYPSIPVTSIRISERRVNSTYYPVRR